ncbi:hydroxylamine reductase [Azospirillum griseum]|uniref:Hydroxylamine reductase n=1 Tax=Azospirillum griseum TaxID=2496639 RepID=A0A431VGY5_9PROT|nr:hydroxylamine reductase [Azospirillum griseum]RTR20144.1 hydroxylamine reductase [Azospirillum griseum]
MFCYQCEQTTRLPTGDGCASAKGLCGKDATTADLQDLLVHAVKGIAQQARRARALGVPDNDAGAFMLHALFTTLTNVNFNPTRFVTLLHEAAAVRDRVAARCEAALVADSDTAQTAPAPTGPAVDWTPAADLTGLLAQAATVPVNADLARVGADVVGLRALILYGMKGVAAYANHAAVLGYTRDAVFAGVEETMAYLASDPTDMAELLDRALSVGRLNLQVMEMLDAANTGRFGTPHPTAVRVTPVAGKAILVSGHDLGDLEALLKQTAGTDINVYTHGEMLPAHGYPALKAYPHLVGNFGGAWQDQQTDFATFPGPILMTSNCIIEPGPRYRQRIFTTGPVGWPGVRHLADHAFAPLIAAAHALPGFKADDLKTAGPEQTVTVGFGGDAVLGVAGAVVEAVKAGDIRHFFLIGGCDGAAAGRNYYSDFATGAPDDTVVLTLGCAKYRFNRHEFGSIGGIPRLLDIGQCNDSYSAIRIASALAEAFGCGVNDLPLSLVVSWFEQKAAAVLLTLLALGIRNIRLGPTLPAFLTPTLLAVLVERFGIQPITTAPDDIAAALTCAA